MKKDANFKLSKSAKRILGTILDPKQRAIYKKLAINAELSYQSHDRVILKGNEKE